MPDQTEEAYEFAYKVVLWIESHLTLGPGYRRYRSVPTRIFRNRDGQLLEDLEEVITDLLQEDLIVESPA